MLTFIAMVLAALLLFILCAVFGMHAKEDIFLKEIKNFGRARIKNREFIEVPTTPKEIYDKNPN
jgi:hypothetical protein